VSHDKASGLNQGHPPQVLNYRSSPVASGALLSAGVRTPNRPCASSLLPAVNYSQLLDPASMVVAKAQCPQAVVLDRMSVGVAVETIEARAVDIVNSDLPAPGFADQHVVGNAGHYFCPRLELSAPPAEPARVNAYTLLFPVPGGTLR